MNPPENEKKISVIKPKLNTSFSSVTQEYMKKRVAAYARVSTSEEEQLSSYEAQVGYYTKHIKSNPDWEFVEVYADEGISGTTTKRREGFNRMIADALDGKIDLILTKSISRFARNTVDTLTTVRKLKAIGVEIYFEKENIYTLDSKGELLITIMSSVAQEESRSISENVTWGKRRSMKEGNISLPYSRFLGYEKGEDGMPKIVESEAAIVRQIYALFLEGQTYRNIAQNLTNQNIPTPSGKTIWSVSTVMSILRNEKYKGDALLQKTFTVDFLNKTTKRNAGEVQQYYIENSHPAIIHYSTFDLVQSEMKRRQPVHGQINSNPFSTRIICSECGGYYGQKVWHSTSKYRQVGWRCNQKYKNSTRCSTPTIREEDLKRAFLKAFNSILEDKELYIAEFEEMLPLLCHTSRLEAKLAEAQNAYDDAFEGLRLHIEKNAITLQDQEKYDEQFNKAVAECRTLENSIAEINEKISNQNARAEKIRQFLSELRRSSNLIDEFDESLWQTVVENVIVRKDKTLIFTFRDGTQIPVKMQ